MTSTRSTRATVAAAAGAADTALFLVRRPGLFRRNPRRALQSVGLLAAWTVLAVGSSRSDGERSSGVTALAAGVFAANAALLAAHLAHRVATPRVFLGPVLSAVVLADSVRA